MVYYPDIGLLGYWVSMECVGLCWVGLCYPPHDHTSSKRQPLVVADDLVRSPFHLKRKLYIFSAAIGNTTHSTGGVDIEIDGDEDQGGDDSYDGGGDDDVYSQHW